MRCHRSSGRRKQCQRCKVSTAFCFLFFTHGREAVPRRRLDANTRTALSWAPATRLHRKLLRAVLKCSKRERRMAAESEADDPQRRISTARAPKAF